MQALNLPPYAPKLRVRSDCRTEVFDPLRRRYVVLTPEEWVRQHFTHYLVTDLGYPAALLANEVSLSMGGATRRCDSVLYDRAGGRARLIVEYKAPDVPISQHTFNQISSYNSVLRVDYLIVSNGLQHYAMYIDYARQQVQFLPRIPAFSELL